LHSQLKLGGLHPTAPSYATDSQRSSCSVVELQEKSISCHSAEDALGSLISSMDADPTI